MNKILLFAVLTFPILAQTPNDKAVLENFSTLRLNNGNPPSNLFAPYAGIASSGLENEQWKIVSQASRGYDGTSSPLHMSVPPGSRRGGCCPAGRTSTTTV